MAQQFTTQLRNLGDINFGILNASKDSYVIQYNDSQKQFNLVSTDAALSGIQTVSVLAGDVIESEIDVNNIDFFGFDGGSFW